MNTLHQDAEKCDCSEGKFLNRDGELVPTGLRRHDCAYRRLRDSFIPEASAYADSKIPDEPGGRLWSRAFTAKLTELMRKGARRNWKRLTCDFKGKDRQL